MCTLYCSQETFCGGKMVSNGSDETRRRRGRAEKGERSVRQGGKKIHKEVRPLEGVFYYLSKDTGLAGNGGGLSSGGATDTRCFPSFVGCLQGGSGRGTGRVKRGRRERVGQSPPSFHSLQSEYSLDERDARLACKIEVLVRVCAEV